VKLITVSPGATDDADIGEAVFFLDQIDKDQRHAFTAVLRIRTAERITEDLLPAILLEERQKMPRGPIQIRLHHPSSQRLLKGRFLHPVHSKFIAPCTDTNNLDSICPFSLI
jgi:hypothetical protein